MTLYTITEAGKELGISAISVRRKVRAGELPHRRIGNLIRFTPDDLTAYIEAAKVPARKSAKEADHA
jgi:excisionase family DNA binding protein